MGEVFLAEDTRLQRRIAIKVLSRALADDPERRQRFEREARAVAALNHPHIVTVHAVEEDDGLPFLAMELVEGRPLSELIPQHGLPTDMLLKVGIAISDAIAAAHQRGITHRDLKPGNVMMTPDGRPKVLDFGLAKLREAELDPDGSTRSIRLTAPAGDLTGEGRIIGTVAYMSPEQAEGKPVDPRSDIFSLGVMLHEMATGDRPFKGDTNVSIISSILKDTPSAITDLNPALPAGLSKIIRRCLAKDPSRRYQTATDLRNELEELKQELDSGVTMTMSASMSAPQVPAAARSRPGGRGVRIAWMTAIAVIVLLAGVGGYLWLSGKPATSARFEAERLSRLTSGGNAFQAAISGDGRYVAHVKFEQGSPALFVRQTATTSDVQIVAPSRNRYDGVTFTPDGNYVYFTRYPESGSGVAILYKVPALGGTPQQVLEDVDSPVTFSNDGGKFAFIRGNVERGESYVMVADADGSNERQLARLGGNEQFLLNGPSWSPDGRTIVTSVQSFKGAPKGLIYSIDVASGRFGQVGTAEWRAVGDVAWLQDGRGFALVASDMTSGSQIWQMAFPSGEVSRITNDLNTYLGVSVSSDGKTIATIQAENTSHIWVAPAGEMSRGKEVTRGRTDGQAGLTWTPDGRIVFSGALSGRQQIFVMNADGGNVQQLTRDDQAGAAQPAVSPDGRHVVYQKVKAREIAIWRVGIDGANPVALTSGGFDAQPVFSPDGRSVYYNTPAAGTPQMFRVSIDGGTPAKVSDKFFRAAGVSGDGKWLLGLTWDTKARRSAGARLSMDGQTLEILPELPGTGSALGPGPGYLTFARPTEKGWMLSVRDPAGVVRDLYALTDNIFNTAWSRDGKTLAVARGTTSSDVVLITRKVEAR